MQAGVSFGAVLADAGYGISGRFRQALSALGLLWAVGSMRIQKVYAADVQNDHACAHPRPTRKDAGSGSGGDLGEAMLAAATWR